MTCIFCLIISGEAKADILYRDDLVIAFRDIHPLASTHILVVPLKHIESVNALQPEDAALVGHMHLVAKELAAREGVSDKGFRLMMNTGREGGQTVLHLHLHLLAGKLARFIIK